MAASDDNAARRRGLGFVELGPDADRMLGGLAETRVGAEDEVSVFLQHHRIHGKRGTVFVVRNDA